MQTSQSLSQDNSALSAAYLARLVTSQDGGRSPDEETTFHASTTDLWVNGLWFVSLTLSLAVALFAVLAKQWLRQYMSIVTGTPRERAFIRQFRYDGLTKWHVPTIVGVIPVILHLSVILFLVGLSIFLAPLSKPMAYTVTAITMAIILLYLTSTLLPLFEPQCPYRTTFTDLVYYLHSTTTRTMWSVLYSLKNRFPAMPLGVLLAKQAIRLQQSASFDSVERDAASPSERKEGDQYAELRALRWLGKTTSSPSAKDIVFESLGAFHSKMTKELAGLGEASVGHELLYSFGNPARSERGMRALVHLRALDAYEHWASLPDRRGALAKLAAGYKMRSDEGEWLYPCDGVEWAFARWGMEGREGDMSEVVWAGLFKRIKWLKLKNAPDCLLSAICNNWADGHATPR